MDIPCHERHAGTISTAGTTYSTYGLLDSRFSFGAVIVAKSTFSCNDSWIIICFLSFLLHLPNIFFYRLIDWCLI